MSSFILIQKKSLNTLAQHTSDVNMLLRFLESKYDPDPTNKYKFMLLPSNLDEHPDAYFVSDCAEWNLIQIVSAFVEKHCPQVPQEAQARLIQRIHNKLIGKFIWTVQVLGEILPSISTEVIRKRIAAKNVKPKDIEEIITSLWEQYDESMAKVMKKTGKRKAMFPDLYLKVI